MSIKETEIPDQSDARLVAYGTARSDVFEMVPPAAQRVLDLGCSMGALGGSLKAAKEGRLVYGVEYDAGFAAQAAQHLDRVITADLNAFDWQAAFGEERFDCMIFADVLEHLVDPENTLRYAVRHLQPGGCVVVSLPNIRHISALWSIFLGGRFPRRDRGIFDRTHLRWFTQSDANSLLVSCGFTVALASYALRWGDIGGGRVNRLLNRLPLAVQRWMPVREFLTYQMVLRAELRQ